MARGPLIALIVVVILIVVWYYMSRGKGAGSPSASAPSGGAAKQATLTGSTSDKCPSGTYDFVNHQQLATDPSTKESLLRFRSSNGNVLDVILRPDGKGFWGPTCSYRTPTGSAGSDIGSAAKLTYSSGLWDEPMVPHTPAIPLK